MAGSPRCIMFQGTGSDVGKTVLVAGLCRVAKNRGINVAPFKPQNMSNNAAVADPDKYGDGGEIGRGQWLQALACGRAASVHMNPVLLKPQSTIGSQVVVQGKVIGTAKAREYQSMKPQLLESVMDSFSKISEDADLVLVEGAGSPAEINLRAGDIANMGFACEANVPVVLVGDIDRGGVIASIVGTHTILPESDRAMIAGFLINKFRGDISLFDDGLLEINKYTGWPSFGILPYLDAVRRLPAEDSVALDRLVSEGKSGVKIVIPVLGKIANFDDFDPLRAEPGVDLVFLRKSESLPNDADMIILPGSKSTIADLLELRANGWEQSIKDHAADGKQVIGICGGYQMLGQVISDPDGLEGEARSVAGLGLLNVETILHPEKITRNSKPDSVEFDVALTGYEIHMGATSGPECVRPMIKLDGRRDGAISADGKVRGCYLHGLFGSDEYRHKLLEGLGGSAQIYSYRESVETALDELAEQIEQHLNVDELFDLSLN